MSFGAQLSITAVIGLLSAAGAFALTQLSIEPSSFPMFFEVEETRTIAFFILLTLSGVTLFLGVFVRWGVRAFVQFELLPHRRNMKVKLSYSDPSFFQYSLVEPPFAPAWQWFLHVDANGRTRH
ncbi:hypothetical protein J7399_08990 [Shimia sp. R9_1]|uniref:hypothetical protein n=1 Tax=Shimia sp. R9_2 TaxID=2821112 RepID=UPI001ADA5D2C|nr:hypothetical protein [Shimia sp. R9_2]MBO9395558.1 hypothetical protein [Shimia sp. R9_2]MBO9407561.1 hypothetical protein [Shimia sp. R9_1]